MVSKRNCLLVCILLALANSVEKGHGQIALCFSTEIFTCSGTLGAQKIGPTAGQQCCDEGFLAYIIGGDKICSICRSNSICHTSSDCSDVFPGLGTQTPGSCCGTGGGSAYVESNGTCQTCPSSVDGCFSGADCGGDNVQLNSTGSAAQTRECCLSENGQSYDILGQCGNCIVYGFLQTRIAERERGQDYLFEIGYLKGTGRGFRGRIEEVPGGTAVMESDYYVSPTVATGRPGSPTEIRATFRVDNIAQEINETAQLRLVLTFGSVPSGAIFQDIIEFVIEDSDVVMVQVTEDDYRSSEQQKQIPVVVSKNVRLANPVTLLLTPFNESEANRTGQPLPANLPPDDNPLSPNRAKSYPPDREDFSSDVVVVTFPADEFGPQINDMPTPIVIFDDEIYEALEEVFIVVLTLENSTNPGGVAITRESSLCRIIDDDEIEIGFLVQGLNISEDTINSFGEAILHTSVESEQSILVQVVIGNPLFGTYLPATVCTLGGDSVDVEFFNLQLVFEPGQRQRNVSFESTSDTIPETSERFEISVNPVPGVSEFSTACSEEEPFECFKTFVVFIKDNDVLTVGWKEVFTNISEDRGVFKLCAEIKLPNSMQVIGYNLELVTRLVAGGTSEQFMDFEPFSSETLVLGNFNRESCLSVTVIDDEIYETDIEFMEVDLEIVNQPDGSLVTVEPKTSRTRIEITDNEEVVVGFIDSPYITTEGEGATAVFRVGVISGASGLEREISLTFSTIEGEGPGGIAVAEEDYISISNMVITLGPGQLFVEIPVDIVNDDIVEEMESVYGNLLNITGDADLRVTVNHTMARADIIDGEAFKCPALPLLQNGRISYAPDSLPKYNLGTVATYICDPGFTLEDNSTTTCVAVGNSSATWAGNIESRTQCVPIERGSLDNTGLVLSTSLVAVVILFLILITITLFTIIIIRRKVKRERKMVFHVDRDHIYEDPDLIRYDRPPLPCRNIRVDDNQAYEKTFEMDENKAYTTGQAPGVNESGLQRSSSENHQDEDEAGPDVGESGVQSCSSRDDIRVNANLANISGQAPESEVQNEGNQEDEVGPDVKESGERRGSSGDHPGVSESDVQGCSSEDSQEQNPIDMIDGTSNSIDAPGGEQDTQNEYLTIIP